MTDQDEAANTQEMYLELRKMWISRGDPDDDPDHRGWQFDNWLQEVLDTQTMAAELIKETAGPAELEVSRAQMMMEVILEIEQVVTMVPPRVKAYRDQLAAAGLDRAVEAGEDGESGQKGLPGINLADQAALEYHSNILGMAFNLAQEEVMDRMRRKQDAGADEDPRG